MAGTELAKAYVQIIPSADGIKGKLSSALGGEATIAGNSAGKLGGLALVNTIKTVIAAAGIGIALKEAISEGANLEQSLGGIETLFKESAEIVKKNAKNAYMTAGLSANNYMESVTSFSASLLQGLAGDTQKAAEIADMALMDMSDNANKMGTSMELIQNAYQGFAKQNYTMLDNLKLGYGGTKTEMQRLLADAEAFSGVKYDISNLSDVYEAIHVIQGEMQISGRTAEEAAAIIERTGRSSAEVYAMLGTTAKESASTISGSYATMKAAFSNVLGSLAIGEDITPAMDGLMSSIGTYLFDNLFPMVGNILTGLGGYVVNMMLSTDWNAVIAQVLTSVKETLATGIETYFGADTTMFNQVFDNLINNVPVFTQMLQEAFVFLWETIGYIWETLGVPIFDAIKSAVQYVKGDMSNLGQTGLSSFKMLWDMCNTTWTAIGQPLWEIITTAVGYLTDLFEENMPAIMDFFCSTTEGIKDTWDNHLKPVFEAIGVFLNTFVKPAFEFVWKTNIEPLIKNVFSTIGKLWTDVLKPSFDGICDFLLGIFTGNWKKAFEGIISIVKSIWNSLVIVIKTPLDLAKEIVDSTVEFIKDKFDFDWKLPELKLPHFSVSGKFSLNPVSVPSFGIEWYAKAMDDPIIMNSPTAFGINSLGQIMAGGEKGSEVVSGTDTLMEMIAMAVASQNKELVAILIKILEAIISLDDNMGDNVREGLVGTAWSLNKREVARLIREVAGC